MFNDGLFCVCDELGGRLSKYICIQFQDRRFISSQMEDGMVVSALKSDVERYSCCENCEQGIQNRVDVAWNDSLIELGIGDESEEIVVSDHDW